MEIVELKNIMSKVKFNKWAQQHYEGAEKE